MVRSIFKIRFFIWIFTLSGFLSSKAINKDFPFFFSKNAGLYDSKFDYILKTNKANVFFGKKKILYQFVEFNNTLNYSKIENVEYNFLNTSPKVKFRESNKLPSHTNYLLGSDTSKWMKDVENFETLEFQNLYEGINLKYYSKDNQLKYDYIVDPGALVSDIKIELRGIQSIKKISSELIEIKTENRTLLERIPVAYQIINGEKVIVEIDYLINGSVISYDVKNYNKDIELIIDPLMVYATYVGGNADDLLVFGAMQKDNAGNIYTAGYTASTNFPTTAGSYEVNYNGGNYDAYVFKMNADGSGLVYSTFFGGTEFDRAFDILLEPSTNNLYVVGVTWSPNFVVTPGAYQTVHASPTGGGGDAFVLKLNAAGNNIFFSTLCGGGNDDMATSVEYNSSGMLVVSAQVQSPDFPVTAGAYDVIHAGDFDGAVMIFNNTGTSLIRSTFLGGNLREGITSLVVDASDNIYVSTHTQGGSFPVSAGCLDNSYNGGPYDMAISKFNSDLSSLLYSTLIGGSGDDWIRNDLHVDATGNLLFSGVASSGFPSTAGSYDASYNGGLSDVFVAELNNTGTVLNFGTFIGSSGDDGAYKCYKNMQNQIVVTGYCAQNYPTTLCCYDETYNGGASDAFISIFNSNTSTLLYSTYIGGSGNDKGCSVECESDTAHVIGETSSTNFPVTPSAYDQSYNGGTTDVMVFKIYLGFQAPSSSFTTNTLPCGLTLPFTNTSQNATTYLWHFGDGSMSNLVNPNHTYISTGTYTVLLIADPGSSCSDTSLVIVNPGGSAPTAQFTYSLVPCTGSVNFSNSSTNAVNYLWDFGDSNFSNLSSPGNTYISPGTYTITLTAEATLGCSDTVSHVVSISSSEPTAMFNYTSTVCAGVSEITNSSINAQSYQWNFGDGTAVATSTNPQHNFSAPGTYQIQLIAANTICSTTDTTVHSITVVNPPVATLINDTSVCGSSNLLLTVNAGVNSIMWSTGATTPSISVNQTSSYWVMLSNGYCTDRDTVNVQFFTRPNLGSDQTNCAGNNVVLTSNVSTAHQWSTGSNASAITVSASGNYWLEVSSGNCIARDTVLITFISPPILNLGNDTSFCNSSTPQPILLDAGPGQNLTYIWNTGSITQTILAGQLGTFWVEVNNGACTVSDTITIGQYSGIELGEDVDLCGLDEIKLFPKLERPVSSVYLWSTGETQSNIIVSGPGTYWVEVTQGQCLFIDSLKVEGSLSDGAIYVPNSFTPGSDYVNDSFYAFGESIIDFKMMVFNRWGEKVFESNDPAIGWDGNFKGRPVQVDTYVWIIDYSTECGDQTKKRKKGVVNVIK